MTAPEYRINVPGFERLFYSHTEHRRLAFRSFVARAALLGASVQSAREAVAFRLAANCQDRANQYQTTRTAAIYFQQDGATYVAFDDHPTDNIILRRAPEGHARHRTTGRWLVPLTDPLITAAIERADHTGRIVKSHAATLELRLDDHSFDTHPTVAAILGDLAAPYGAWLQEKCNRFGNVHTLGTADARALTTNDAAEIRRVDLGTCQDNHTHLFACCGINEYGWSRRVR